MKFKIVKKISDGMSKDDKFVVEIEGQKFFLRKTKFSLEKLKHYEMLQMIKNININLSKLQYLHYDDNNIYAYFDYIEGYTLGDHISFLSDESLCNYGIQSGRILKQIHTTKILKQNMTKSEFTNKMCIDMVIEQYKSFNNKLETTDSIFRFIRKNMDSKAIGLDDYCYLNADL